MTKTNLVTVPTFEYKQGTHKNGDFEETPIHVEYYNGTICLRQEGGFDIDESINLSPKHIDGLFKAIKKHLADAEEILKRK